MNQKTPFEADLAAWLIETLALEVTPEDIDPTAPLFRDGLGLDSIDMLEMALAVSKKYGFQLRADDADNANTFSSLRALGAHIEKNRTL